MSSYEKSPAPAVESLELPIELKVGAEERERYLAQHGITVEVLPDGSRLVAANVSVPDAQVSKVTLTVRVGANDDPPGKAGVAHLLEHMLFTGCGFVPDQHDQQRAFVYQGYKINARTGLTETEIRLSASSGQKSPEFGIQPGIKNLTSMFMQPVLSAERLTQEREVVKDEYLQGRGSLWEESGRVAAKILFPPEHPLRCLITGDEQSLAGIARADLDLFRQRYYVPANTDLIMVSHGDPKKHESALRLLKEVWDSYGPAEVPGQRNKGVNLDEVRRINLVDHDTLYEERLDVRKGRVWVGTASAQAVTPYSPDYFASAITFTLLRGEIFTALRTHGYGYTPRLVLDSVPDVGIGLLRIGITVEKSKADQLAQTFKPTVNKLIQQALVEGLPRRVLETERRSAEDQPIGQTERLDLIADGLRTYGQILRAEDLQTLRLQVTEGEVANFLRKLAENPGPLFLVGDF